LVQIILADDHSLMRDILRQYLEHLSAGADVIEADNLPDVLACAVQSPTPDLILLDLQMPGMSGVASVADVRKTFPTASIVVVSGITAPATIREAIQCGANGYIPKTTRGKSVITALKLVMAGETYLPMNLLDASGETAAESPGPRPAAGATDSFAKLTEREAGVLRLLIEGKTNKEIGRVLTLQEVTVKVHLRNVYRKIKASNRTDAVRIAMQQGWG